MIVRVGSLELDYPSVMGVLNVTPDSFSDGGKFVAPQEALKQAGNMIAAGADILDVGGESTRPGADSINEQEELDRVIPIIESICDEYDVAVSIDTSKPGVMREAVAAGAAMINDVGALQADGALSAAVELQQPVCLMHMQGQPRSMQAAPHYDDVVVEVVQFLEDRVKRCVKAGLGKDLLVVDPGFGFGKTPAHNIELLSNLRQLQRIGCPVLIGVSRKSTLGVITGRDVDDLLPASIAAAVFAVMQGAQIIRAHDVAETVDALSVVRKLTESGKHL
jgi:dihydropteroate synthase